MRMPSQPQKGPFTGANGGNKGTRWLQSRSFGLCYLCSLLFKSLVAVTALLPAAANAQAIQAWVQRFNPVNAGNIPAMATDAVGSVVVAGMSDGGSPLYGGTAGDWETVKYSSAGVPLWTNYYNGPSNNVDMPLGLAIDSSGNVLVTGFADGPIPVSGVSVTIKYSSAGVPLWTNRYSGTGDAWDGTVGVALDATGNVFVTGATSGTGGSSPKILTIKYSSQGIPLWTRQYNPQYSSHGGAALATDSEGNLLVAAAARAPNGENYGLTLKYSSAGTSLWTRLYRGLQLANHPLAVDGNNNVVVTGSFYLPGVSTYDILTIKYTSAGVPSWTNRYDGPVNGTDYASAVAVDASGNVYVAGEAEVSDTIADYATIKYTSAGAPLWTNLYGGPGHWLDGALALALDANGNVFVTGRSYYTGGNDSAYATVAYSKAGMPLWSKLYDGPGSYLDFGWAIAVDASGNVFVTGESRTSSGNVEYTTVKYVVAPIITRQPVSLTNSVGTPGSFTVEVAGSAPFSYQWRRGGANLVDGGNISGVTTTNLLIADVQTADAADYSVAITNAYGSVTSHVAQLTVVVPPNSGRFSSFSYSPQTGFSFIFRDATVGQPYRIQRSFSMAQGSWTDWQSFIYTEPIGLTDVGATGAERRFYRAVSP